MKYVVQASYIKERDLFLAHSSRDVRSMDLVWFIGLLAGKGPKWHTVSPAKR